MSDKRNQSQPQSVLVEAAVKKKLDERFIETDDIASIVSLAFQGNKNAILFGPGGFGKSGMIGYITESLFSPQHCSNCKDKFEQDNLSKKEISKKPFCEESEECGKNRVFIQSFGEGMSEDRLYGGMDFKHFDDHREMRFKPEHSFLNYECAIFEEIFDAPPVVLLSLKDTLTARELRNGEQRFPMKTRCIIALTNKEPNEISSLGPSAHALVERFPLQLNVTWNKFNEPQWKKLFNKVKPRQHKEIKDKLAGITALVHERGGFVSPRTAVHALETAIINSDRGLEHCFDGLQYIAGYQNITADIEEEVRQMRIRQECVDTLVSCELDFTTIDNMFQTVSSSKVCGNIIAAFKQIDSKLEELRVTDDLYDRRSELRSRLADKIQNAREKMIELAENESSADELLNKPIDEIEEKKEPIAEVGFSEETIEQMRKDGVLTDEQDSEDNNPF